MSEDIRNLIVDPTLSVLHSEAWAHITQLAKEAKNAPTNVQFNSKVNELITAVLEFDSGDKANE